MVDNNQNNNLQLIIRLRHTALNPLFLLISRFCCVQNNTY